MKDVLTSKMLHRLLNYDSDTGIFRWRVKPNRRIRIGDIAGVENHGRMQIRINGIAYRSHRLAWLYMFGKWPRQDIDHINGNALDNRIANLRDVSVSINLQNQRKPTRRNRLGFLGVSRSRQKVGFRARINNIHIGTFKTPELAHQAYLKTKREIHLGNTL